MKKLILVLMLLAGGATLEAQGGQPAVCESSVCEVSVGAPFVAFTEHDPTAFNYTLIVDGQVYQSGATLVNGLVEFSHPGFPVAGNHSVLIRAQTSGGFIVDFTDTVTVSVVKRKLKIRR
jgi:hypothetical protein